jgi:hypothetical protein
VAGYSGTPLDRKLGITSGHRLLVVGAPDSFFGSTLALVFVTARADLAKRLPGVLARLVADGAVWVAWPKKASKMPTDITEDVVRDVALPLGVVDNKVCAIDETWSGLRLVVRVANRARWPM